MQVLKRPIITEKATKLNEARQYVFDVEVKSNKIEIRKAIETQFTVDVVSIRTARVHPKSKAQSTRRGRFVGRTSMRKKAYITIKDGQKIDFGTGVND
jgi:large subunit ribosomal protein L23